MSEDIARPVLESIGVSPGTVNTSAGPATLTVTARVTDSGPSGFRSGGVVFKPSGAGRSQQHGTTFNASTRTSGDEFDGTYSATFELPQYAAKGVWRINRVQLSDNVGNVKVYQGSDPETIGVTFENV